jgi:secernin
MPLTAGRTPSGALATYAQHMCDTLVLVEPGRVLFAKNSDRDPNEAQPLEWHPAASHAPGGHLRCTWVDIPQVEHTHATLLSRPFWMWGAEMGANEHGVVIGNEAVFTKQPYATTGLTGMDLLRLALERAASAEAAVDTIIDLLDTHGQGGGCGHEDRSFTYHNSFLVADRGGAFVLETAGPHHAVERVERGARSISNGLTIPGFADRYADRLRGRVAACDTRRRTTEAHAARAHGPAEMMAALRDHGTGGPRPRYTLAAGGMAAPCMHAGGVLAASQSTASWVSELTPASARHWATATSAPCTGLFKPVDVEVPLDLGPTPTDRFDPTTVWWRHERLHRAVARDPGRLLPPIAAERDAVEARWLAGDPDPSAAFGEADELTARWLSELGTAQIPDRRPPFVRRYWRVRDSRAALPSAPLAGAATARG